MTRIAGTTEAATRSSPTIDEPRMGTFRWRRRVAIVAAVLVLGWSVVELANLAVVHTIGPELYGVLVAALAVAAGIATLILLRSADRRLWAAVAVLVLWSVIAIGGLAGTVAHIVGPVAGHGPVDARPRPIAAPLVFTFLGLAEGAALWFGQRRATARTNHDREE